MTDMTDMEENQLMKLPLTVLLCLLLTGFAGAANLTGHWAGDVALEAPDGTVQTQAVFLDLSQEGDQVTGSGGTEGGTLPLENVQFDGKKLSFSSQGPDGRIYTSKLSLVAADRLEGTLVFAIGDGTEITCRMKLQREPAG
jgi:hypothetical protein